MELRKKLIKIFELYNVAAVARAAGLKPITVQKWAKGIQTPRSSMIGPVARVLRIDLEWLLDDSAEWPPAYTLTKKPGVVGKKKSRRKNLQAA